MDEARLKLLEHQGFGYWLAGFIDGEGTFNIHKRSGAGEYRPRFKVAVRADEIDVMTEIVYRTGIARLRLARGRGGAGEQAVWEIYSHADCGALVQILDRFPLRAKKRLDYEIWREAVAVSASRQRGEPWDRMAELKRQLEEGRRYENALELLLAPQTDRTDPHVGQSAMLASGQRY